MSLIQEALKRQHEESRGKDGAGKAAGLPPEPAAAAVATPAVDSAPPPAVPGGVSLKLKPQKGTEETEATQSAEAQPAAGAPPPLPSEAGTESEAPEDASAAGSGRSFKGLKLPKGKALLIGGIAAGIVIVGALAWVGSIAVKALSGSDETAPASETPEVPAADKKPAAAKPATNVDQSATAKKPEKPADADAGKKPEKPAVSSAQGEIQRPAQPAPAPVPKKEVTQWPILTLTGVLGSGGGSGGALLNNEIVGVGQEIMGVKVVSINANATVTLSFKGQSRTLRIGDLTN